jgi:hypothetical protein
MLWELRRRGHACCLQESKGLESFTENGVLLMGSENTQEEEREEQDYSWQVARIVL